MNDSNSAPMANTSPATSFAACVSRAQELSTLVQDQQGQWSRVLQSHHELAERLHQFADGGLGGNGDADRHAAAPAEDSADWGAWARSETSVEPLSPMLRVGLRVHWLVSSSEAILASLAQGHEAAAACRWLELRAAAGRIEALSDAFPIVSTARSSLEHTRVRLVAVCLDRLRAPKLSPAKAAVLLAAVHSVGGNTTTQGAAPPAVALLSLFFDARADAALACTARALDPGGDADTGGGDSATACARAANGLRSLCDILDSSQPHALLRALCVGSSDGLAPSGDGAAPLFSSGALLSPPSAPSLEEAASEGFSSGAAPASASFAAAASSLEEAAADGWKLVAEAVDSGARILLGLTGEARASL